MIEVDRLEEVSKTKRMNAHELEGIGSTKASIDIVRRVCRVSLRSLLSGLLLVAGVVSAQAELDKPRVIVTTDGEADDQCSMVRYLLYADQFETCGLIYSSSKHHWAGDGAHEAFKWHGTTWIQEQLDAYAAVHPSLVAHAAYPPPEALRAQVAEGNIALEGDMAAETAGSRHLAATLLDDDDRPVWLLAWGGANTIARALKSIAEQHPDRVAAVSRKARLYLVSEQDATYRDYIGPHWPELTTLLCSASTYGAIAYRWEQALPVSLHPYFSAEWHRENLLTGHGPLAAKYVVRKDKAFRSEGDSVSFMHLIDTGIGQPEDPTLGGWGGRFVRRGALWQSTVDKGKHESPLVPWVAAFQNDLAARAAWCVLPYDEANHAPVPQLEGPATRVVAPGASVSLRASASPERADEQFTYRWWHYDDADSAAPVVIENAVSAAASFTAPETAGTSVHIILEVTDNGSPPLTRWRRVVCTVGG